MLDVESFYVWNNKDLQNELLTLLKDVKDVCIQNNAISG